MYTKEVKEIATILKGPQYYDYGFNLMEIAVEKALESLSYEEVRNQALEIKENYERM